MIIVSDVQKDLDINIRKELNDFIIFKMGERNITDMKTSEFESLAGDIKQEVCDRVSRYYSVIDEVSVDMTPEKMRVICRSVSR